MRFYLSKQRFQSGGKEADSGLDGSCWYKRCCLDFQEGNESAAILKIKESMQEEAKRFEKEGDHPDYNFMSQ